MSDDARVLERRYELAPQLRVYDAIGQVLAPYLTLTSPPDYRSDVLNTDRHGFRRSVAAGEVVDTEQPRDRLRYLVLGGSYAFGVGASSDSRTIVSALGELTGQGWLNLGVRAGNSTQELISALPFLLDADAVVVVSGVNDLVVSVQSLGLNDLYGPLFGEGQFARLGQWPFSVLTALVDDALSGAPARALVGELAGRARRRLPGRYGAGEGRTSSLRRTPAAAAAQALELQTRNLELLRRSVGPACRVVFAVQPLLDAADHQPTPEELELCSLADALQTAQWHELKGIMNEVLPGLVEGLRAACARLGVGFVDLNEVAFEGWSFVDRVHANDAGYAAAAAALAGVAA